jgi:hypothetical protein
MTLEEFARKNDLPQEWVSQRQECEGIVRDPQFWSHPELQTAARKLALEASDILQNTITLRKADRSIIGDHCGRKDGAIHHQASGHP